MHRLPSPALDSWLNGALDGDMVTSLYGPIAWQQVVQGASLLGHAVTRNRLDLVRDALDQAADPNLMDRDGVSPVRMAVLKQRGAIFRLLAGLESLDRQAGASPWPEPEDAPDASAIFFPTLAFDLGRYGTPGMAGAWGLDPAAGWETPMPLWKVLEKRGHYHRQHEDHGHALDAALLHNRVPMAAWLLRHTMLTPSVAVLNHGHGFSPTNRDDPPISPHPALVMVGAMLDLLKSPPDGRGRAEHGMVERLDGLRSRLQGSKTPWKLGDAVLALTETWRLHRTIDEQNLPITTARGRRRL